MTDQIPVKEQVGGQATIQDKSLNGKPSSRPSRPHRNAGRWIPADITREEAIRRLESLYRLTRLIGECNHDIGRLTASAARMASEFIGDMSVITLLNTDGETYHISAYYDPNPSVAALFEQTLDEVANISRDQGWVAGVIRTGQPMLMPGISMEQATASAVPAFIEFTRQVGIASMLIVPIAGRSGVLGAIALTRHGGGRPYDENDQSLMTEIAYRLGVAIENFTLVESLRQEVSGRRFAKEALAASEQRFLSIFQATTLGINVMDLVGTILETNPAYRSLTGYQEGELIAAHFYDLVHPDDVARVLEAFTQLKTRSEPHARIEHRMICKDGSTVWVRTTFAAVKHAGADPTISMIFGISEDFTERKQADTDLLEFKQHLQRNIEMERLHLAKNLHDVPLQELYAVIYKLEELRAKLDTDSVNLLGGVIHDIQETLNSLRATASELRPPALSRFGLEKAIRSYVEDFREKNIQIQVRLSLAHDRQLLPEEVRLILFRVLQEALSNVVRHAQATEVQVRFNFDAEEARMEISDNGQGFRVPSNWMNAAREGHFGLASMVERVSAAAGTLVVESVPGASTTLRVSIPLPAFG